MKVIALVTAYNEAATIDRVLTALKRCPDIDYIHVVDDGSTDETATIAQETGVAVTSLPRREPVGEAIMHHLTGIQEECLLVWCDADLIGLTPDMISRLVEDWKAGNVTQTMSSRGVPPSWPGWLRRGPVRAIWAWLFGPISGERVILYSDFQNAITLARSLGWAEMMRGYGIVIFLNWYSMKFGMGNRVIYFDTLRQRQKYQKWGKQKFWEMPRQWVQFAAVWIKIRLNARIIRQRKNKTPMAARDLKK